MEETKTEKKKIFSKQNGKKLLSVLLVVSLLVGAMYAFLTSTDVKVNTFTVGNIDVTLHEDNWDAWYKANPTADRDTDAPDFAQNIVPNQPIEKAPYVTNDSTTNAAWVYLTVAVPIDIKDNIISSADSNGDSAIEGTKKQVTVYAYGIQDHYTDEATETAEGVWAKYVSGSESTAISALDYKEMYGEAATDTSDRYVLFQTLVGDETSGYEVGVDTSTWTKLGTTYKSSDGYNYTVYKLAAGKLEAGGTTEPLFDAVKLVNAIGDTEPVLVYYYTQNVENSSSAGVGAAVDTADVLAPEIDGYTLYAAEEVDPGDGITLPTATSDIVKDGSTITWNTATDGTGDEAYTGMKVTQNTNLYLNYTELATSAETSADYSWLEFKFNKDFSNATLMGADSTNSAYPTEPTTVIVPSSISVTCTEICTPSTSTNSKGETVYSHYYYIESDYALLGLVTPATYYGKTYNYSINSEEPTYLSTGTFTVPVTTIYNGVGNLDKKLTSVARNVVLPDSITTINSWHNSNGCILESINIPYNCTSLGGSATSVGAFFGDSSLVSITIPGSVTSIGAKTFQDCSLTSIKIPASVKSVYHSAFGGCKPESIVWLSTAPMCGWVSDEEEYISLAGIDPTNLKFIYSNSSEYYMTTSYSSNGVNYEATDCKLILTNNTQGINLSDGLKSDDGYSSINYMGTKEELYNVTPTKLYAIMGCKTIGEYVALSSATSTYFNYNCNYTLTAEDLAIINAA